MLLDLRSLWEGPQLPTAGGTLKPVIRRWIPIEMTRRWRLKPNEAEELLALGIAMHLSPMELAALLSAAEEGFLA